MMRFLGIDLGWYGKPSGVASLEPDGAGLRVHSITRLEGNREVLRWVEQEVGTGSAMAAVDAPLVIPNATGIRDAERELNRDFRRFHAGCHAANLGRPFAGNVTAFSRELESLGFRHGAILAPRQEGRYQIEIHPHAATVTLFGLAQIVKYKRGTRDEKSRGLGRLRRLITTRMPLLDPPLTVRLPSIPRTGNTKPVEDMIDAVLCAYIGARWWWWGKQRNRVYGSQDGGYIVVPQAPDGRG